MVARLDPFYVDTGSTSVFNLLIPTHDLMPSCQAVAIVSHFHSGNPRYSTPRLTLRTLE